MQVVTVIIIVLVVLFGLAFLTRRRFGVLGLALAAGAMLSSLWAEKLTPIVEKTGVHITAPPLNLVVTAALILLPAIFLLFSGPTYHRGLQRFIGSLAFALLALAFLLEPLGSSLVLDSTSKPIYDFMMQNRVYIVTAGLIFALFDILATRTPKHRKESGKH